MTVSEKLYHTQEFTQAYNSAETPVLPENLSHYCFVSCLADSEHKRTWLLKKPNGQRVVCKYATGEYMDMLRTESEFFSFGKFSFVPYVYDYFETQDGAYLLREYIEGRTLSELVEKDGPLPMAQTISLIEQLCKHLSHFHTADPPIIYRDLKPSNIVLKDSGDCYLIDLGTVRTYHEDNSADTIFIGTTETAAPEQYGARQTDARTDIYGLGVLFYYLLTGELGIRESVLKKLPRKAARIIRKCTAFDPDNRYSDVGMMVHALHGLPQITVRQAVASVAILAVIALTVFRILPEYFATREVVFTSALLEQAVRSALDKPQDEPVYGRDLKMVTHLYVCGNEVFSDAEDHQHFENYHAVRGNSHDYGDITDISLLKKMPNLHTVVLDYQHIFDISPLQDLELISLSLCGNPVIELSALQEQKILQELYLSETGVSSLDALKECSALTRLDCSFTPVTSLEPLTLLPIHNLYLKNAPIENLEVLAALPLAEISLSRITAEDLVQAGDLPSLTHLTLSSCDIRSLKEIAAFRNLYLLDLNNNLITDLDGIEQFANLGYLLLTDNPVTDYTPAAKMSNLIYLDIPTTVTDFTFLNEMPGVQYIKIRNQQLPALYEAVPEPWFEVAVY